MTIERLKEWFATLMYSDLADDYANGKSPYYVGCALPTLDFNKEICPPGTIERFPEGVVGLRTDDNFFTVGAIPYEFRDLSIKDIAETLYAELYDTQEFSYNEDQMVITQNALDTTRKSV